MTHTATTKTAADFPVGSFFTVKRSSFVMRVVAHGDFGSGRTIKAVAADGSNRGSTYFVPARIVAVTAADPR